MGRLTIFDFKLFEIDDPTPDPDVIVVHHTEGDENDENDGPGDIFGRGS
jgi:hypothetical protein